MNTRKKKQSSFSALDQFNNFCKAMAEQELFEAGVFPNAKDAGDVHDELAPLSRPSTPEEEKQAPRWKVIEGIITDPHGNITTVEVALLEPKAEGTEEKQRPFGFQEEENRTGRTRDARGFPDVDGGKPEDPTSCEHSLKSQDRWIHTTEHGRERPAAQSPNIIENKGNIKS
jgi:hypothetical protein